MRQRSTNHPSRLQTLGCCIAVLCLLARAANSQDGLAGANPLSERSASDRPSVTQLTSTVSEIESSSNSIEILIKPLDEQKSPRWLPRWQLRTTESILRSQATTTSFACST